MKLNLFQYMKSVTRDRLLIRVTMVLAVALTMTVLSHPTQASGDKQTKFKPIRTQYIAALGNPDASSGTGAQLWGLWREDPGPRGVWLGEYTKVMTVDGVAPSGWNFNPDAWWLEENGRIMEQPEFPITPGKYVVTGNRGMSSVLTIHPADSNHEQRWELENGASLYDVTHLGCRSAVYTSAVDEGSCTPARAQKTDFPVQPGAQMPAVNGCNKQDYQVLIVTGIAVEE